MNRYGGLYLATAVALVPIDILFLGVFAKGFFASQVRDIMGGGQAGGPVPSALRRRHPDFRQRTGIGDLQTTLPTARRSDYSATQCLS